MRVSARHAFLIPASAALALFAAPASAGGGGGNGGGGCCTPPPPPTCCNHGGGHTVNVPNINIHGGNINVGVNVSTRVNVTTNVNVDASASASANANAGASGRAGAGAITFIGGGSYTPMTTAPAATAITGLNVVGLEAEAEYEYYEEERTRWVEEWRVVRAVCVDDNGTPHPASRVDADERVGATFDGEIYRCMAGTAMQVTIGWLRDSEYDWSEAPTIMCRKGEALRHSPGGRLYCETQEARRNCNERSLLRRHGPGVKLVFMRREERYTERVRREVERERVEQVSMTLMLDGGVGGYR
ncbi:hypothetical protein [Maricaulis sp.]|uniref:hypothetical protein n=1 Tax=Maricaulis sp. TaxID=1486257 RepID=UPI00261EA747|nr:hypothetical protein [Maricaulis sp.]